PVPAAVQSGRSHAPPPSTTVLSHPPVLPAGVPTPGEPGVAGSQLPVAPEPLTDGGGDRLVVTMPTAVPAILSATLLAAQQLSEEADAFPRRWSAGAVVAERRRRMLRAVLEQRRADRSAPAIR
ncbi:MAG: hypothetical protein JWP46_4084, partial [Modestobacter sp.]|nr:hypothetical protein [Modestobacter sp.]